MRKLIIPIALLMMAAMLASAVAVDCVRLAADGHERTEMATDQMAKQEQRLVGVLENSPKKTPEVEAAIATWKSVKGRLSREHAYESLVAAFQRTMSPQLVATDPIDRKFMDEAAGAINRREVAHKTYAEESGWYDAYLKSWRGRVAQKLSEQARVDVPQQAELPETP